jgi:hypothetical protein
LQILLLFLWELITIILILWDSTIQKIKVQPFAHLVQLIWRQFFSKKKKN